MWLLSWLVISSAILSGCRSASHAGDGDTQADRGVPPDFMIECEQGGGFAGRWSGTTITADGLVSNWTGNGIEHKIISGDTLSDNELGQLWKNIGAAKFFENDSHDVGNVTAMITVAANGKTHKVTWLPSLAGFEKPGSPLDSLFQYCRGLGVIGMK